MKVIPVEKGRPIALFEKKLAIYYGIWGPLASYLRKCYKPNPEYMQKPLKTRQQIAAEYGVDRKTLYRWLKAHDIQLRGKCLVSPAEQEAIYKLLGSPYARLPDAYEAQEK